MSSDHHMISLNIDMKMIRPLNCSGGSLILAMNFWTSWTNLQQSIERYVARRPKPQALRHPATMTAAQPTTTPQQQATGLLDPGSGTVAVFGSQAYGRRWRTPTTTATLGSQEEENKNDVAPRREGILRLQGASEKA